MSTNADPIPGSLPRRRRRWRKLFIWAALVLLLLLAAGYFLTPMLVRAQLRSMLAGQGIELSAVTVERVTPWRIDLTDIRIGGAEPVLIARVTADYSPASLWAQRVHRVRIEQLTINVVHRDGQLEAGPLRRILARESAGADAGPTSPSSLPFEQIELVDAKVVIAPDAITLSLNGSLTRSAGVIVTVTGLGDPVLLTSDWNRAVTSSSAQLKAPRLDARLLSRLVAALHPAASIGASGDLRVDATLQYAGGAGRALMSVNGSDISIDDKLGNTNVKAASGVFTVSADLAAGRAVNVVATLEKANVQSAQFSLSVSDASGRLELADPLNPSGAALQRVEVGRMQLGQTEFRNGAVVFALEGWTRVRVAETSWNWFGGRVTSSDVRYDNATGRTDLTLVLERVGLRPLLDFIAKDRAAGDGTVSGTLSASIDWPHVEFGDGQLRTDAGGNLQLTDTAAIDQAVAQSTTGDADQTQIKQRIVEALRDFQYDLLQADLVREGDSVRAEVRIAGRGSNGARQPIKLDLNVRGLDKLLNAYLGLKQKLPSGN